MDITIKGTIKGDPRVSEGTSFDFTISLPEASAKIAEALAELLWKAAKKIDE
jgi:hypothetical protein